MKKIFTILTAGFLILLFSGAVYGQKDDKETLQAPDEFIVQVWRKSLSNINYSYAGWRVVVNGTAVGQLPCEVVVKIGDKISIESPPDYQITNRFHNIVFVDDVNNSVQIDDHPPKVYYLFAMEKKDFDSLMNVAAEKLADIQCIKLNPDYASILKHLPSLKNVQVTIWCIDQNYVKDIEKVYDVNPELTSLGIVNYHYFERNINPVTKFKNLESLDLTLFQTLTDISPLEKLTELKTLKLQSLLRLKDLTPLSKLSNLRSLDLIELKKLSDISPIAKLKNLERLNIVVDLNLFDLSPIAEITSLKSLVIQPTVKFDFNILSKLNNLQELKLAIWKVDDISPLSNLHKLRYLSLGGCYPSEFNDIKPSDSQLTKMVPLDNFPNLVSLDLSFFDKIDELPGIENDQHLLRVNLTSLPLLKNLDMLSNITSLRILKIADCTGITSLEPLKNLTNLTSLELSDTPDYPGTCNVADLSPLRSLKNLKILKLIDCDKITDISPLYDLTNLEYLVIVNCDNIKTDDVEKLQKLNPSLNLNP